MNEGTLANEDGTRSAQVSLPGTDNIMQLLASPHY